MSAEERDTKKKILTAATGLFAKHGFNGTSIRDIAKEATVNLAAINYHFKNKEKLYFAVFDHNYDTIKAKIAQLAQESESSPDLAVAVYRFFISSGAEIMNTFRIFLSENVDFSEDQRFEDERVGPPGQEAFFAKIKHDLGTDLPEEGLFWAVKMIFSQIVHLGVVMNTSMMKARCSHDPDLQPEKIEQAIRHSARAHLEYLKANAKLWM